MLVGQINMPISDINGLKIRAHLIVLLAPCIGPLVAAFSDAVGSSAEWHTRVVMLSRTFCCLKCRKFTFLLVFRKYSFKIILSLMMRPGGKGRICLKMSIFLM